MKYLIIAALAAITFGACTKDSAFISTDTQEASERTAFTISGKIMWENNHAMGVRLATVNLTGAEVQSTVTDSLGNYSFTVNTPGSYSVKPVKNINRLNGCTNADVLLIQRQAAGLNPITDPYKQVAGDINRSNFISTIDASLLNQSILGNPLANAIFNVYWRFVDSNVSLTVPPWAQLSAGIEQVNLNSISTSQSNVDFIGIKVGDVDGSCNPLN